MKKTEKIIKSHIIGIRKAIIEGLVAQGYSDTEIAEILNMDRTWVFRIRKSKK